MTEDESECASYASREGPAVRRVIVSARLQAIPEVGTATPVGVDFAATSGTVTWADGDGRPEGIPVQIFDDVAVEGSGEHPGSAESIHRPGEHDLASVFQIDFHFVTMTSAPTLSLSKSIVAGCRTVIGRLVLANPAPAGGRVVFLSGTLVSATMPARVTVPGGATTATFSIKTTPVTKLESGTITANFGGTIRTHKLSVRRIGMLSVALVPTTVAGTNPVAATAKLGYKAAPGPIMVDLASSNAAIAHPVAASIVVPQGLQSVPFDVATSKVCVHPGKLRYPAPQMASRSQRY